MASISAVTFNSGSTIDGTIQVGQLAIGSTPQDYTNEPGGLRWWSSADLDSGYIIAHVNANANQPNSQGISGVKVGFWRTQFTDSDFISWAEYIAKRYHTPETFSTATEANIWLFANGYWTSYSNEPIPTTTLTPTLTTTPTPTPTPSSTPSDDALFDPIITENDEYIDLGNDEYLMFVDPSGPVVTPSSTPEVTTTPTPSVTETPTNTPTPSLSVTLTPSVTPTITPTSSEVPVTPTPSPTSGAITSGFTVTIQEVGSDVIWSGSGSLDISNLSLENTDQLGAGFAAASAIWAVGPNSPVNVELYGGVAFDTYPTSFGSGGSPASNGTGDLFGILEGGSGRSLVVPENYISGTQLSGSTTYANTTISGLNLVVGTYTYSWGTNPGETLTLIIG